MTRAEKAQRARAHKFYDKARKAGYRRSAIWLQVNVGEELGRRAKQLSVPKESVIRAAVECGLRRLTAGEIQASDRRWHEHINLPMPLMVKRGYWRVKLDPLTKKLVGFEPVPKSA